MFLNSKLAAINETKLTNDIIKSRKIAITNSTKSVLFQIFVLE